MRLAKWQWTIRQIVFKWVANPQLTSGGLLPLDRPQGEIHRNVTNAEHKSGGTKQNLKNTSQVHNEFYVWKIRHSMCQKWGTFGTRSRTYSEKCSPDIFRCAETASSTALNIDSWANIYSYYYGTAMPFCADTYEVWLNEMSYGQSVSKI